MVAALADDSVHMYTPVMPKKKPEKESQPIERVVVQLWKDQADALFKEAVRRAEAEGTRRPNVSEIVREAVAAWLKGRK